MDTNYIDDRHIDFTGLWNIVEENGGDFTRHGLWEHLHAMGLVNSQGAFWVPTEASVRRGYTEIGTYFRAVGTIGITTLFTRNGVNYVLASLAERPTEEGPESE